jgi:hypothetical protein
VALMDWLVVDCLGLTMERMLDDNWTRTVVSTCPGPRSLARHVGGISIGRASALLRGETLAVRSLSCEVGDRKPTTNGLKTEGYNVGAISVARIGLQGRARGPEAAGRVQRLRR